MAPFIPIFTHPPKYAALPTLYAALGPDVKSGDYFGPTGFNGMKGKPGKVKSKPHSYDEKIASELWDVSEKTNWRKNLCCKTKTIKKILQRLKTNLYQCKIKHFLILTLLQN